MTRLSLIPAFTLLASQASAHPQAGAHVHTSSPLSLAVVGLLGLVLIGFTIGTAALIRARSK